MQQTDSSGIDYKKLYDQQIVVIEELSRQLAAHDERVSFLSAEIAKLRKMIFGTRVERFVPAEGATQEQLTLALQISDETASHCKISSSTKIEYVRTKVEVAPAKPKAHPGRMKLPEHLRREVIVLMPDQDVTNLRKIGEEVTEVLEYVPADLYVKQFIRFKYAAPAGQGASTVLTASLPGRLLEKCMAGEGILAQMIVDKYLDHLPIHRQLQRFERMGVRIPQSTSNDWVKNTLSSLHSIYQAHKRITLATSYLSADETPIKVLDETKKGTTSRGYYWVYYNSEQKLVLFDYRTGRGREGPNDILQNFQGYLQTDGYSVYNDFEKRPGITLLHCMAHARRKFHEALENDRERSEQALAMFGELYAIERKIRELSLQGQEVVTVRQEESMPILQRMKQWMEQEYAALQVKKSAIAQAMIYFLSRWEKWCVYTRDGRLNIDNNPIENAIRPVALGRKNYLFSGSHEASERAAMIYSLLATCKLHDIDPYHWLKNVLETLHQFKANDIESLLPQNWKQLPQP